MALWDHLCEKLGSYYLARMELFIAKKAFFSPGVDRVAELRRALSDEWTAAAIPIAAELPAQELIQLFPELVLVAARGYYTGNIPAVRALFATLPRDWVLQNIERVADPILQHATSWEFRRLLELYAELDEGLTRRLAARAVQHPDWEIREAGEDALEWIGENATPGEPTAD